MELPDGLRVAAKYLVGVWPSADEDALRELGLRWEQASRDAVALHAVMSSQAVDVAGWEGDAREKHDEVWRSLMGDQGLVTLAGYCGELARSAHQTAAEVEKAKVQAIMIAAWLVAATAWALAVAPLTAGASLGWLASVEALAVELLSEVGRWLVRAVVAAASGAAFMAGMDSLAQGIVIAKGDADEFDPSSLLSSAGIGALAGLVGLGVGVAFPGFELWLRSKWGQAGRALVEGSGTRDVTASVGPGPAWAYSLPGKVMQFGLTNYSVQVGVSAAGGKANWDPAGFTAGAAGAAGTHGPRADGKPVGLSESLPHLVGPGAGRFKPFEVVPDSGRGFELPGGAGRVEETFAGNLWIRSHGQQVETAFASAVRNLPPAPDGGRRLVVGSPDQAPGVAADRLHSAWQGLGESVTRPERAPTQVVLTAPISTADLPALSRFATEHRVEVVGATGSLLSSPSGGLYVGGPGNGAAGSTHGQFVHLLPMPDGLPLHSVGHPAEVGTAPHGHPMSAAGADLSHVDAPAALRETTRGPVVGSSGASVHSMESWHTAVEGPPGLGGGPGGLVAGGHGMPVPADQAGLREQVHSAAARDGAAGSTASPPVDHSGIAGAVPLVAPADRVRIRLGGTAVDSATWERELGRAGWHAGVPSELTSKLGPVRVERIASGYLLHTGTVMEDPARALAVRSVAPDPERITLTVTGSHAASALRTFVEGLPIKARESVRLVMPDHALGYAEQVMTSVRDVRQVVAANGPVSVDQGHAQVLSPRQGAPEATQDHGVHQWLGITRKNPPLATRDSPGPENVPLEAVPMGALYPSPGWDQVLTETQRHGLLPPGAQRTNYGLVLAEPQPGQAVFDDGRLSADPSRLTVLVHGDHSDPAVRGRVEGTVRLLASHPATKSIRLAWDYAADGEGAAFLNALKTRYSVEILAPNGAIKVLDGGAALVRGAGRHWLLFGPETDPRPHGALSPAPGWQPPLDKAVYSFHTAHPDAEVQLRSIPAGVSIDAADATASTLHPGMPDPEDLHAAPPDRDSPAVFVKADPTAPATRRALDDFLGRLAAEPGAPGRVALVLSHPAADSLFAFRSAGDVFDPVEHELQRIADTHHLHLRVAEGAWTPDTEGHLRLTVRGTSPTETVNGPAWREYRPNSVPLESHPNPVTELRDPPNSPDHESMSEAHSQQTTPRPPAERPTHAEAPPDNSRSHPEGSGPRSRTATDDVSSTSPSSRPSTLRGGDQQPAPHHDPQRLRPHEEPNHVADASSAAPDPVDAHPLPESFEYRKEPLGSSDPRVIQPVPDPAAAQPHSLEGAPDDPIQSGASAEGQAAAQHLTESAHDHADPAAGEAGHAVAAPAGEVRLVHRPPAGFALSGQFGYTGRIHNLGDVAAHVRMAIRDAVAVGGHPKEITALAMAAFDKDAARLGPQEWGRWLVHGDASHTVVPGDGRSFTVTASVDLAHRGAAFISGDLVQGGLRSGERWGQSWDPGESLKSDWSRSTTITWDASLPVQGTVGSGPPGSGATISAGLTLSASRGRTFGESVTSESLSRRTVPEGGSVYFQIPGSRVRVTVTPADTVQPAPEPSYAHLGVIVSFPELATPKVQLDTHGRIPAPEHGPRLGLPPRVEPDAATRRRLKNAWWLQHTDPESIGGLEALQQKVLDSLPQGAAPPGSEASWRIKSELSERTQMRFFDQFAGPGHTSEVFSLATGSLGLKVRGELRSIRRLDQSEIEGPIWNQQRNFVYRGSSLAVSDTAGAAVSVAVNRVIGDAGAGFGHNHGIGMTPKAGVAGQLSSSSEVLRGISLWQKLSYQGPTVALELTIRQIVQLRTDLPNVPGEVHQDGTVIVRMPADQAKSFELVVSAAGRQEPERPPVRAVVPPEEVALLPPAIRAGVGIGSSHIQLRGGATAEIGERVLGLINDARRRIGLTPFAGLDAHHVERLLAPHFSSRGLDAQGARLFGGRGLQNLYVLPDGSSAHVTVVPRRDGELLATSRFEDRSVKVSRSVMHNIDHADALSTTGKLGVDAAFKAGLGWLTRDRLGQLGISAGYGYTRGIGNSMATADFVFALDDLVHSGPTRRFDYRTDYEIKLTFEAPSVKPPRIPGAEPASSDASASENPADSAASVAGTSHGRDTAVVRGEDTRGEPGAPAASPTWAAQARAVATKVFSSVPRTEPVELTDVVQGGLVSYWVPENLLFRPQPPQHASLETPAIGRATVAFGESLPSAEGLAESIQPGDRVLSAVAPPELADTLLAMLRKSGTLSPGESHTLVEQLTDPHQVAALYQHGLDTGLTQAETRRTRDDHEQRVESLWGTRTMTRWVRRVRNVLEDRVAVVSVKVTPTLLRSDTVVPGVVQAGRTSISETTPEVRAGLTNNASHGGGFGISLARKVESAGSGTTSGRMTAGPTGSYSRGWTKTVETLHKVTTGSVISESPALEHEHRFAHTVYTVEFESWAEKLGRRLTNKHRQVAQVRVEDGLEFLRPKPTGPWLRPPGVPEALPLERLPMASVIERLEFPRVGGSETFSGGNVLLHIVTGMLQTEVPELRRLEQAALSTQLKFVDDSRVVQPLHEFLSPALLRARLDQLLSTGLRLTPLGPRSDYYVLIGATRVGDLRHEEFVPGMSVGTYVNPFDLTKATRGESRTAQLSLNLGGQAIPDGGRLGDESQNTVLSTSATGSLAVIRREGASSFDMVMFKPGTHLYRGQLQLDVAVRRVVQPLPLILNRTFGGLPDRVRYSRTDDPGARYQWQISHRVAVPNTLIGPGNPSAHRVRESRVEHLADPRAQMPALFPDLPYTGRQAYHPARTVTPFVVTPEAVAARLAVFEIAHEATRDMHQQFMGLLSTSDASSPVRFSGPELLAEWGTGSEEALRKVLSYSFLKGFIGQALSRDGYRSPVLVRPGGTLTDTHGTITLHARLYDPEVLDTVEVSHSLEENQRTRQTAATERSKTSRIGFGPGTTGQTGSPTAAPGATDSRQLATSVAVGRTKARTFGGSATTQALVGEGTYIERPNQPYVRVRSGIAYTITLESANRRGPVLYGRESKRFTFAMDQSAELMIHPDYARRLGLPLPDSASPAWNSASLGRSEAEYRSLTLEAAAILASSGLKPGGKGWADRVAQGVRALDRAPHAARLLADAAKIIRAAGEAPQPRGAAGQMPETDRLDRERLMGIADELEHGARSPRSLLSEAITITRDIGHPPAPAPQHEQLVRIERQLHQAGRDETRALAEQFAGQDTVRPPSEPQAQAVPNRLPRPRHVRPSLTEALVPEAPAGVAPDGAGRPDDSAAARASALDPAGNHRPPVAPATGHTPLPDMPSGIPVERKRTAVAATDNVVVLTPELIDKTLGKLPGAAYQDRMLEASSILAARGITSPLSVTGDSAARQAGESVRTQLRTVAYVLHRYGPDAAHSLADTFAPSPGARKGGLPGGGNVQSLPDHLSGRAAALARDLTAAGPSNSGTVPAHMPTPAGREANRMDIGAALDPDRYSDSATLAGEADGPARTSTVDLEAQQGAAMDLPVGPDAPTPAPRPARTLAERIDLTARHLRFDDAAAPATRENLGLLLSHLDRDSSRGPVEPPATAVRQLLATLLADLPQVPDAERPHLLLAALELSGGEGPLSASAVRTAVTKALGVPVGGVLPPLEGFAAVVDGAREHAGGRYPATSERVHEYAAHVLDRPQAPGQVREVAVLHSVHRRILPPGTTETTGATSVNPAPVGNLRAVAGALELTGAGPAHVTGDAAAVDALARFADDIRSGTSFGINAQLPGQSDTDAAAVVLTVRLAHDLGIRHPHVADLRTLDRIAWISRDAGGSFASHDDTTGAAGEVWEHAREPAQGHLFGGGFTSMNPDGFRSLAGWVMPPGSVVDAPRVEAAALRLIGRPDPHALIDTLARAQAIDPSGRYSARRLDAFAQFEAAIRGRLSLPLHQPLTREAIQNFTTRQWMAGSLWSDSDPSVPKLLDYLVDQHPYSRGTLQIELVEGTPPSVDLLLATQELRSEQERNAIDYLVWHLHTPMSVTPAAWQNLRLLASRTSIEIGADWAWWHSIDARLPELSELPLISREEYGQLALAVAELHRGDVMTPASVRAVVAEALGMPPGGTLPPLQGLAAVVEGAREHAGGVYPVDAMHIREYAAHVLDRPPAPGQVQRVLVMHDLYGRLFGTQLSIGFRLSSQDHDIALSRLRTLDVALELAASRHHTGLDNVLLGLHQLAHQLPPGWQVNHPDAPDPLLPFITPLDPSDRERFEVADAVDSLRMAAALGFDRSDVSELLELFERARLAAPGPAWSMERLRAYRDVELAVAESRDSGRPAPRDLQEFAAGLLGELDRGIALQRLLDLMEVLEPGATLRALKLIADLTHDAGGVGPHEARVAAGARHLLALAGELTDGGVLGVTGRPVHTPQEAARGMVNTVLLAQELGMTVSDTAALRVVDRVARTALPLLDDPLHGEVLTADRPLRPGSTAEGDDVGAVYASYQRLQSFEPDRAPTAERLAVWNALETVRAELDPAVIGVPTTGDLRRFAASTVSPHPSIPKRGTAVGEPVNHTAPVSRLLDSMEGLPAQEAVTALAGLSTLHDYPSLVDEVAAHSGNGEFTLERARIYAAELLGRPADLGVVRELVEVRRLFEEFLPQLWPPPPVPGEAWQLPREHRDVLQDLAGMRELARTAVDPAPPGDQRGPMEAINWLADRVLGRQDARELMRLYVGVRKLDSLRKVTVDDLSAVRLMSSVLAERRGHGGGRAVTVQELRRFVSEVPDVAGAGVPGSALLDVLALHHPADRALLVRTAGQPPLEVVRARFERLPVEQRAGLIERTNKLLRVRPLVGDDPAAVLARELHEGLRLRLAEALSHGERSGRALAARLGMPPGEGLPAGSRASADAPVGPPERGAPTDRPPGLALHDGAARMDGARSSDSPPQADPVGDPGDRLGEAAGIAVSGPARQPVPDQPVPGGELAPSPDHRQPSAPPGAGPVESADSQAAAGPAAPGLATVEGSRPVDPPGARQWREIMAASSAGLMTPEMIGRSRLHAPVYVSLEPVPGQDPLRSVQAWLRNELPLFGLPVPPTEIRAGHIVMEFPSGAGFDLGLLGGGAANDSLVIPMTQAYQVGSVVLDWPVRGSTWVFLEPDNPAEAGDGRD
ncbi:hypothetical protein [Streptomyces sp. NPDC002573]|uniref:WXG100-like domain-containing protein n=1 Tax=Streptomyces sp. NPDC002573 TaxID=3364651 RepID=UPI00368E4906